jgi:FkbM family methyltransferase
MRYNTRAEVERIGRAGSCLWLDAPEGFAARYLSAFWLYLEKEDKAFTPHAPDGFWEAWITCWMSKQFDKFDTFVDVGANVGYYSMMAAKAGLLVTAFEPNPEIANMLRNSAILNRVEKRVGVWETALSDTRTVSRLFVPEGHSGGASLSDGAEGVLVDVEPFDYLYSSIANKYVLMKIDAEGAEPKIWAGMQNFFAANHCTVILEWESARFDAEAFAKSLLANGENHAWYVDTAGNEVPLVHWRQFEMLKGIQMVVVRKAS